MTGIRESKKVEKKERLLKVSLDLFIDKGFDHTSIEDITSEAGVAKGTFYNFFEKKEDVLLYYLDRELVKSRHEIEQKIDDMETVVDKLELLIITYLKYIFRNKGFAKVLVRERVCKIGTGKNWNEMVLMQAIKQLLDEAREQGELKKTVDLDNTVEIVFAIFTMYTIYWMNGLIKDKKECAEKVRGVLKMLFDGIGEI
jgi:AcrR family transcriptional regulator